MKIQTFVLGMFQTNCYLLIDEATKQAAVIDPGQDPDELLEALEGLELVGIWLTHGHLDHIAGVEEVKQATGAPILIHELEKDLLTDPLLNGSGRYPDHFDPIITSPADRLLKAGDVLTLGEHKIEAPENRRQAPECPNEPKLTGDGVNGKSEPHVLRERETMLDLDLHVIERIARREKIRVQVGVVVGGKRGVADLVCRLKRTPQQITTFPHIPENFAGLPSIVVLALIETGLPGVFLTLTVGQLISQIYVEEFTLQFLNLPGCEFVIYLCLGAEFIGVCSFSWLLFGGEKFVDDLHVLIHGEQA